MNGLPGRSIDPFGDGLQAGRNLTALSGTALLAAFSSPHPGDLAMPAKKNPLGLNGLQLKTLTLFQALARLEGCAAPSDDGTGDIEIISLPHPHGDHFHLGHAVVASRDATGLENPAVWAALGRKGLIRSATPHDPLILTAAGLAYDTGLADHLLYRTDH